MNKLKKEAKDFNPQHIANSFSGIKACLNRVDQATLAAAVEALLEQIKNKAEDFNSQDIAKSFLGIKPCLNRVDQEKLEPAVNALLEVLKKRNISAIETDYILNILNFLMNYGIAEKDEKLISPVVVKLLNAKKRKKKADFIKKEYKAFKLGYAMLFFVVTGIVKVSEIKEMRDNLVAYLRDLENVEKVNFLLEKLEKLEKIEELILEMKRINKEIQDGKLVPPEDKKKIRENEDLKFELLKKMDSVEQDSEPEEEDLSWEGILDSLPESDQKK